MTNASSPIKNQKGNRMWPSLKLAAVISDWANLLLICSLAVVAICTGLVVWMANVKEEYWDIERDASSHRIAELSTEAEKAKAGIATAQSNAAAANERAATAQAEIARANERAEADRLARVKIEASLAPRSIPTDLTRAIITDIEKFAGTPVDIFVAGTAGEDAGIARQITGILQAAKWDVSSWSWTGAGPLAGIFVLTNPAADPETLKAASALSAALFTRTSLAGGTQPWPGNWATFPGMLNGPPFNAERSNIRVVIGPKP